MSMRPVSFQTRLRLHCRSSSGIAIGTITPQTISSYSAELVGITPRFASTMAMISAMMAPETLEAHWYFCSRKMDSATPIHMTPIRPQMLSAVISVWPKSFSNNVIKLSLRFSFSHSIAKQFFVGIRVVPAEPAFHRNSQIYSSVFVSENQLFSVFHSHFLQFNHFIPVYFVYIAYIHIFLLIVCLSTSQKRGRLNKWPIKCTVQNFSGSLKR